MVSLLDTDTVPKENDGERSLSSRADIVPLPVLAYHRYLTLDVHSSKSSLRSRKHCVLLSSKDDK